MRRWESNEGLPVHRLQHDKRGSVYAYARELDEWRNSRRQLVDGPQPAASSWIAVWTRSRWMMVAVVLSVGAFVGVWLTTRVPATPTRPNPEAVLLVERASNFASNAGRVQVETAIRTFQEAIRIDPGYARAWSGLASAYLATSWLGESPISETTTRARKAAEEALRLDPSFGRPWRVLAFASHYVDYNHSTAEAQFQKAIELSPDDAVSLSWYGDFLTNMGRFDEARRLYVRAQETNPRWLEPMTFAANLHDFAGHPDLAIAEHRRVLEIEPGFGFANHFLGRAYLATGQMDLAVSQLRKSDELLGHVPFSRADFGFALARAGLRSDAESMLAEMMRKRSEGYYPAFPVAMISLGLGKTDQALDWIERAVEERHVGFYFPSVDPLYESIRSHPRFRNALKALNIAHRE